MSLNKRISGDYNLTTVNNTDNIHFTTHTVYVHGNLAVAGNTVFTSNSSISSNFLVLNDGVSPTAQPLVDSGITVTRGFQPDVSLRWFETQQVWQITSDGTNYSNILTNDTVGSLTTVSSDLMPSLGGNLDVGPHSVWSSYLTNQGINTDTHVRVDSNLALQIQTSNPLPVNGYTTITASPIGAGGTGVYVTNDTAINEELASNRRALIYALIF